LIGDGHTSLQPAHGNRAVPVTFYRFEEGLFITRADPRFRELAGAQVLDVAGHSVDDVFHILNDVIPQDNSMGLLWLGPRYLRFPAVARGLGFSKAPSGLALRVKKIDGTVEEVTLPEDAGMSSAGWVQMPLPEGTSLPLYLKRQAEAYWFEYLDQPKL